MKPLLRCDNRRRRAGGSAKNVPGPETEGYQPPIVSSSSGGEQAPLRLSDYICLLR